MLYRECARECVCKLDGCRPANLKCAHENIEMGVENLEKQHKILRRVAI